MSSETPTVNQVSSLQDQIADDREFSGDAGSTISLQK
jgi:hypothetical protein